MAKTASASAKGDTQSPQSRAASRMAAGTWLTLSALELLSVIFVYPNSADPPPAWRLVIFAVLSAIVVILAIVSLLRSRRPV